ncbi:hypothetical protein Scep_008601 [Stephania cephalantha]|uniref:Uncharacterized protein n=1 Tax=Stephania cephalantha TaxID=152367 RepID=A0AAP0PPA1_9MAGN
MKFMKLGSKPDMFQTDGNGARYVASELPTDIVIRVGEKKFHLHKFPLQSKSNHLQKLIAKADEEKTDEIHMPDFPAGPKAFEICAKFCYDMTVTLNAYNIVAARCAAEYLGMTEDVDQGNLVMKTDAFFNSCILRGWKDSIIALKTTKSILPYSKDLKIVRRCIDSIASRASVDPLNVTWSYTYKKRATAVEVDENWVEIQKKSRVVPKDWWVEDLLELEIDLYKQVILAIKSKERMPIGVIGQAVKAYAVSWLPNSFGSMASDDNAHKCRVLVEAIVSLLPSNEGVCISSSFLLKLLKFAVSVQASDALKEELVKRISLRLNEASAKDLLIPAQSPDTMCYDVGLVQTIVNQFVTRYTHIQDSDYSENDEKSPEDFVMKPGSWLIVGKLIDRYLAEIARDQKLPRSSFIELAQSIPKSARPVHDRLYKAIDVFLKEHPSLDKTERKEICALIDVEKLSLEASKHAAQNERLPLRVIVQVVYFRQLRAATGGSKGPEVAPSSNLCTSKAEKNADGTVREDMELLKKQMKDAKLINHGEDQ